MLHFQKTELADLPVFRSFLFSENECSCENTFVNMLVWQPVYENMWALSEGQLIIRSGRGENTLFRLPFGDDFEKGMALIFEHNGGKAPDFWAPDGERFRLFRSLYGQYYEITESRDASDYLYSRNDLATLAGKRYHSKRNHIHAFEKQYEWQYRPITEENKEDVFLCAEQWYRENEDRAGRHLRCEADGIRLMLDHREQLGVLGGAIYVEGRVVAFTIGSPVNDSVFDIHVEKALSEYASAYTLINREFAKTLSGWDTVNREDDMGKEGLRKAKLSYHPSSLLPKYFCKAKETL